MRQAFERAVALHKDSVFSFALYYLGNRQEAEDVTQEVLLKLWSHGRQLPEEAIGPWLNRVTRNASIDSLRRRASVRRFVWDGGEEDSATLERVPTTEAGPDERTVSSDLAGRVQTALRELPEPYRSSMILREVRELSYREVAEALDLPVNTVKTHVHRGRRMLRQRLSEEKDVRAAVP